MPFIELPVDIILSVTQYLSYIDLASMVCVNKSLADLLIPYLYNLILKSRGAFKRPFYGRPPWTWVWSIRNWHSPTLLKYFKETPVSNLTYTDLGEATLIHLAARANNISLMKVLLSRGFAIDEKDGCGRTPLHYALDRRHERMVNFLLTAGADVMPVKGYSLVLAAESCSFDVVMRIVWEMDQLEARFKPFQFIGFTTDNTVQIAKNLALYAATVRDSREIVDLLIVHGADTDWATACDSFIQDERRTLGMEPIIF